MGDQGIPSRLPPLNSLRAFEATARRGSVSAAARELGVTHGAVSHQIRALEETLGSSLFERGSRRMRLTAQGALLLPAVAQAFGDIAAATARLQRPEASGTLTIMCVAGLLSFWLLPRLHGFTDAYPGITLNLSAGNDPARVGDPEVDLVILYGRGSVDGCWSRLWSSLRLFPVVSPSLIASRPLRSVRDLRHHTLLHGDRGGEWATWLTAADAAELPRGRQHFLGDARLSTEAAVHGQGVAVGDTITAARLISDGDLVVPFDLSVAANDSFFIACRNEMRSAPIVKAFVDWMFATLDAGALPEPRLSPRSSQRRPTNSSPAP